METTDRYLTTKEALRSEAPAGLVDRFDKQARLAERDRCATMLSEYIAQGRTSDEIVAYAQSLLRTDY